MCDARARALNCTAMLDLKERSILFLIFGLKKKRNCKTEVMYQFRKDARWGRGEKRVGVVGLWRSKLRAPSPNSRCLPDGHLI